MFPLTQQTIPPIIQTQIETQLGFFTALSRQMLENMEKINKLNMQAAAHALEESASITRELLSALTPDERRSISQEQFQNSADRVRAYQEQVAQIFTDAHTDLAKTMETHRPVSAVSEVVAGEATEQVFEETNKAAQRKKEQPKT